MGQFPVIFVTLKGVAGVNFAEAENAMRYVIGNEASRFDFLRSSDRLTEDERATYRALTRVDEKGRYGDIGSDLLVEGLKKLSELLAKHYGKKIILLIDEYDVPSTKRSIMVIMTKWLHSSATCSEIRLRQTLT